jgi:hypothetical protein
MAFTSDFGLVTWAASLQTRQPPPPPNVYNVVVNNYPAPQAQPVAPVYDPKLDANALYGKPMPLSVLGYARIGASPAPIVGPYINAGKVDFIVSFGVPANVTGSRKVYKIYLDSELAWSSVTGGTVPADGTFTAESFDFTFQPGTLTQGVCTLEDVHFPGDQNAYRPQLLLQIRDLTFQRFLDRTGKPVPYVACDIGDVTDGADPLDGINIGTGLELIAHSPWAGYTSDTFEAVGITDVVPAILIKDNFDVIQLCQTVTQIYRNIDLLQSDKLRVKDRGASTDPDIVFDRDSILQGDQAISLVRGGATEQRRELELVSIDPDQDYMPVPSLAKIPRDPFAISAAVGKQTITTPLVMNASIRQALVTYAQQYNETARRTLSFKSMAYGYQVEPGDFVGLIDIADGIDNEVFKVRETSHGANFVVDIMAEAVLRCRIFGEVDTDFDPFLPQVVLLMGFDGNLLDESPHHHGIAVGIGGAHTTSVSPMYGTGSLILDASTDSQGITYPDHIDWCLSTSNSDQFTIDVSVTTTTSTPTDSSIISQWGGGIPLDAWMLYVNTAGDGELQFLGRTGGFANWDAYPTTSGLSWVPNQKYDIRVDKDIGGVVRIYRDGVMVASATPTDSSIKNSLGPLTIGCNSTGGGRTWPGSIDEVRITKGQARTGNDAGYTVQTDKWPRV